MKKNALEVLLIALAVTVIWGCGQSSPPQADPVAKTPAQAPTTPVTVVDEKKPADVAQAKPPAAAAREGVNPANAQPPAQPPQEPLPEIVAKVGDEKITAKEFERRWSTLSRRSMGMPSESVQERKRGELKRMIQEKAVLALAKSQGMTVADEDVQKELDRVKSTMSPEAFQKLLESQNIKQEELPDLIRDSLIMRKYADEKTKDLAVTDEQVTAEFERMKGSGGAERKQETTDVAHILVKVAGGADEAAWTKAKEKIDAASARVVAGEKFADVAKEVTDDPGSKEQGGLYTDVPKGKMTPAFDEKMLSTPVGQVSEPFRTQYGWHILTVVAKNPTGPMTLDNAKDGIKKRLLEVKRFQARDQMMQDAEKGAKVEILYAPFAEAAKPPEPPIPGAPPTPAATATPAAPADAKPAVEGAEKK